MRLIVFAMFQSKSISPLIRASEFQTKTNKHSSCPNQSQKNCAIVPKSRDTHSSTHYWLVLFV